VIHFVLAAFRAAGCADIGTQPTKNLRKLRPPAHQRRGGPTHFGTIAIGANATHHLRYVALVQAGTSAMLAGLGTANTSFDATSELVLRHIVFSLIQDLLPGGLSD
jgi:hypothetical protein